MKNKYILIAIILLTISIVVILQNNHQKLPNDDQIKNLFGNESGREFVNYEVINNIPYVRFTEKENSRECKVNLVKDYKFGIFNGKWIFGQDWQCSY